MKPLLSLFATGVLSATCLHAALDIVPDGDDATHLLLKDTATGKVLGTFWDRENNSSDYGFESSVIPDLQWSADRMYVAVTAGSPRFRAVSLYRVTPNSLREIPLPSLTREQAAEIDAIEQAAGGTDAVRWDSDGTLLLKFWARSRVASETETPKTAELWANVEVAGDTAKIVGTSTMEPVTAPEGMFPNPAPPAEETLASRASPAPTADEGFSPASLTGTHRVVGKNTDGETYEGEVEIQVADGVVDLKWTIAGKVSQGQGLFVGQTLGVVFDDGLAIYRLYGQSDGQSLIGMWVNNDSTEPTGETILIGNADMTSATVDSPEINGRYLVLREVADGQIEGSVILSGSEAVKRVAWTFDEKTSRLPGLAIGDGLVALSPAGLSVYERHLDNSGQAFLAGRILLHDGGIANESLSPLD